jgi:hypothetical protein
LLLLAQSCSGPRTHGEPEPTGPAATPQGLELWVDAQAAAGGDGSATHPWRRLEAALAGPAPHRRVHLAPGLYPGPFLALDGTEVLGGSAAVLTAPAGMTLLEARGAVSLKRLLLQGGALGLGGEGQLRLEDVHFSGQRKGAIALGAGGTLFAERVVFEASVSEGVGLRLASGARAELLACTFEGPWQRGIEAHAPESLAVTKSHFRGAVTALHLRGGSAELSDVTLAEGRGPGLYVGGGHLGLHRVQVSGHEYGLLTGSDAVVEAEDFTTTRADRAGVAVVNSKAHFLRLTITSAGTFGGLQGVASEVSVDGLKVEEVAGVAVFMRGGSLRVEGGVVARTRVPDGSPADGMQLRGGRATLSNLTVREASGACVLAAEGADVVLSHATLERCHTAGLVAESGAHLTTSAVTVQSSDGPGAVATGDGELILGGFRAVSTDGVVWAECASGAHVTASEVAGSLPALPCIQVLSAAAPPLGLP